MTTIDQFTKRMKKQSKGTLFKCGAKVVETLRRNWARGQGGDGTPLAPGSPAYLRRKERKKLKPIINLSLTGKLVQSISVKKIDHESVGVYFQDERSNEESTNNEIMDGLISQRPNILKLSEDFKNKVRRFYARELFKK